MKKILNNEKGIALVTVLLMITVMSILAVALMGITATNVKLSSGERDYQSAYYIAEAGANLRFQEILSASEDEFDQIIEELSKEYREEFQQSFGDQPKAEVTLEEIRGSGQIDGLTEYQIKSKGTIGNRSRTVIKGFTVEHKEEENNDLINFPFEYVIYATNTVTIEGGWPHIEGDIALNGEVNIKRPESHNGQVFTRSIEAPFPDFSLLPSQKDVLNYEEITGNFEIDVSNGIKLIHAKRVDLKNNDSITINGDGRVLLFVEEEFSVHNHADINKEGESKQLTIFYDGENDKMDLNGGITASLYLKNADLDLNTKHTNISGAIISRSIIINSHSKINYQEPDFSFPVSLYTSENREEKKTPYIKEIIINELPVREE